MKNIFIWFFTLALCVGARAQLITVKDQLSLEAVENVKFFDEANQVIRFTNAKGEVDISGFKNSDLITVNYYGYETVNSTYGELSSVEQLLLVQDQLSLDEIVVSANRWEQNKSEVPNRIATIRKKDVLFQNPQTSADLLESSGEVFIQKSQMGGGSPMIRGFATNRVLLTIDGVRMNTAIFRGGNLQNVISLDPLAMDRVEVVFGPGSVIYGSDAIGGVMNFYTLEPRFSDGEKPYVKGSALARYSSANHGMTGHFDVNIGWEKWASVTSISYSDFGDMKMGSFGPDEYLRPYYAARIDTQDVVVSNEDPEVQKPTAYEQINLMQKIRFKPSRNWDLNYAFHYSTTSDYARYDRLRRRRSGTLDYGAWYYGPQEWLMHQLKVTNTSENFMYDQVSLNLAYQFFEESRHSRKFGSSIRTDETEFVDAYSVNLDFEIGDEDPHRFFYGAEFVYNDVSSVGVEEDILTGAQTDVKNRYPQSQWASYAVYASYEFVPSDEWALHAGARYNGYSLEADFAENQAFFNLPYATASLSQGALTGNFGAVYSPALSWKIRANLSTGFRSPNVDDMGKIFDPEPGTVIVPNPDLRSEYAYNADLGLAKVFGNFLKMDITGYYTLLDNALVRRPYTFNGQDSIMYQGELSEVVAIQNAARARVYGIQAGIDIDLPGNFSLWSKYSWQKGEEELDNGTTSPSRHAAPGFGTTHFIYQQERLKLDVYANYNEEVSNDELAEDELGKTEIYASDANGNPYAPAWYTLNFKAAYQLTDEVMLSVGLENITDQRYTPYSSGMVAPGRNLIMSFRAAF